MAKYRKTHLFAPAPIEEDKCFTPGDALTSFDFGPLRFGLTICYDLRFPEIYRALAVDEGANVFAISSAWPFPRVEHQRVLATARAIENQSYVILANRVGKDDGVPFCGSSAVIDPYGVVVAAASADREELIVAERLVRSARDGSAAHGGLHVIGDPIFTTGVATNGEPHFRAGLAAASPCAPWREESWKAARVQAEFQHA